MPRYSRYVAIGDSQTEGLWDGDDSAGLTGYADRLATIIDSHHPGWRMPTSPSAADASSTCWSGSCPRIGHASGSDHRVHRDERRDPARTVFRSCSRRSRRRCTRGWPNRGATVVTTTFPDLAQILPIGRVLVSRVEQINGEIRTAAARHGFRLVDLYDAPSMVDPEIWSRDRIHGSTKGHILFAAAAAEALGLPGSNHDWAQGDGAVHPSLRSRAHSQVLWTQNMLMPWLWRHVGRSEGDGRSPNGRAGGRGP